MRLMAFAATALATTLVACTPNAVTTRSFAETVSGQVFDFHYESGEILVYGGSERFYPDQRVVWVTVEGSCQEGRWYAQDNEICFDYGVETYCWRLDSTGLVPGATFRITDGESSAQAFPGTLIDVPQSCSG